MHDPDRHPEFPEPSSSSPPERHQELSASADTPTAGSMPLDHHQETLHAYDTPPSESPSSPMSQPATEQRSRRRGLYLAVASAIIAALLIGGLGGWLLKQYTPVANSTTIYDPSMENIAEKVAQNVRTAVVQINVQKSPTEGSIGSGVIIDHNGYIVTNNHVIEGEQNISVVLYNGSALPAQLTGTDPADDLAIVHITPPKNITIASVGDSSKLRVAQHVLAIGNPLGVTQTVTEGIVSALGRIIPEGPSSSAVIINAVQTDAAINPGNSGGALVDMEGNLIGIPTLVLIDPEFNSPANGVGFAIPSNRVQFIAPQLINAGKVLHSGRAALGVQVINVDPNIAAQNGLAVDHGAYIAQITPGGPADQAGLKVGDIIVQADTTPVNSTEQLQDVLIRKDVGQTISLKIYRGNQPLTVMVKSGELQVP